MSSELPPPMTFKVWQQVLEVIGGGGFHELKFYPMDKDDYLSIGLPGHGTWRTFYVMEVTWDATETEEHGGVTGVQRMTRRTAFPVHHPPEDDVV